MNKIKIERDSNRRNITYPRLQFPCSNKKSIKNSCKKERDKFHMTYPHHVAVPYRKNR